MQVNLLNPSTLGYASRAHFPNSNLLMLIGVLTASGCFPPPMSDAGDSMETETGFGSETSDLPGDGDGDPGDGDGDSCNTTPTVDCSDGVCWASDPTWTAEARATEADGIVTPGIWVPVNLGVGTECWELWGVGTHVCIAETCGARLLGTPADEMPLEPDLSCDDFTGVWESTAKSDDGHCYGVFDGVAVELRTGGLEACLAAEHIEFAEVLCTQDGCEGRWQGTDVWSPATPATELLGLPAADPSTLWACEPDPAVDGCYKIDMVGHTACVWIMNGWAVPVAPCCVVDGSSWLSIGDGMAVSPV
jgi:hypothetical protein